MLLLDHLIVDLRAVLEVVQHLPRWKVVRKLVEPIRNEGGAIGGDLGLLANEHRVFWIRSRQVDLLHLMRLGHEAFLAFDVAGGFASLT